MSAPLSLRERQRRTAIRAANVVDICAYYQREGRPNPYHEMPLPEDLLITTNQLADLIKPEKIPAKVTVMIVGTDFYSRINDDLWRLWPESERTTTHAAAER